MQFLKSCKYNLSKLSFIFFITFCVFFSFSVEVSAQKKYTVVLDAGHGGKDSGNIGNGYREKKIALQVALDVGRELLTAKDINVVYTRKKDVFVELHNRAKIANSKKADLFVSIHCDAFTKESPHGASTFVLGLSGNKENLEIARKENAAILYEDNYQQNYDYDPNSPESVIGLSVLQDENLDNSLGIASIVQENFVSLKRNNRRVKQANFLVLRETVMPSVLIELGFLTNKAEGRFLNTRSGQIKMAKAIAKAIKKYIQGVKLNDVNNAVAVTKKKPTPKITKPIVKKTPPKKTETKEVVVAKKEIKRTPKKIVVKAPVKKSPKVKKKAISVVEFKVQIAASKKYLDESNFNFKGLKNVESMFIDDYYKYYYGNTSDFLEIKKVLTKVRKTGYKDAWVVAFKDGQRITIKEALKNR
ncbi:N-acetylmuramoyl-L-alanine amidase [Tenacibaculum sp. S7007]|uniref:N-acetylmuramoyl-L-alanine amidase n=1 Tax=Tenacibaculum pelagium TaxID=2759527 RepID=A0A839AMF8_9FLAO|nr:N-acetylmuramoyl-L-alanine amidase [Tenacibaculum pelagium]MBA6155369.1 N-acetylmuramoyl-L-alanine amidase [Tenacibaculum pelagium]